MNTLNYSGACDWAWGCDREASRGKRPETGSPGAEGPRPPSLVPVANPSSLLPPSLFKQLNMRQVFDSNSVVCRRRANLLQVITVNQCFTCNHTVVSVARFTDDTQSVTCSHQTKRSDSIKLLFESRTD